MLTRLASKKVPNDYSHCQCLLCHIHAISRPALNVSLQVKKSQMISIHCILHGLQELRPSLFVDIVREWAAAEGHKAHAVLMYCLKGRILQIHEQISFSLPTKLSRLLPNWNVSPLPNKFYH